MYTYLPSQVTGRLFNLGAELKVADILAFPVLDCAARHPRYAFRVAVNEQGVPLSRNTVLLLRLYTIDTHSSQLVIVGNCLCEIVGEKVRKDKETMPCLTNKTINDVFRKSLGELIMGL